MPIGTLIIRTDADVVMGTGHAMRCLALAHAWQDQGGDVMFAMATSTPLLDQCLRSENVGVVCAEFIPGSEADARWLTEAAREFNAKWVVIDGYQFDGNYQRIVKRSASKLMFVDDNGKCGRYFADIVLNQNADAGNKMYSDRELPGQLLLGTTYAMLRREFARFRQFHRAFPPLANRVLVMMGGSDPPNVTAKIIHSLHLMNVRFEAKVVVGGSNPHTAALESLVAGPSTGIELIKNARDIPGLMAWADIAISAAGSTCWEICLLGLPSILLDLAPNQTPIARELHSGGCAIHLGSGLDLSTERMAAQMEWLLGSLEVRTALSSAARKLVDGRGADRVVCRMLDRQGLPGRIEKSDVEVGKDRAENPGIPERYGTRKQSSSKRIAICQPTYLPWIGYFDLIDQVDVFVLLDDVQFEKQSWQQRNRIKTPAGLQWLTVPVKFRGLLAQLIRHVEIRDSDFWQNHCRAIELNYRRAPFFENYSEILFSLLRCDESNLLVDLNLRVITWVLDTLGIQTPLVCSSALRQQGRRSELLANICQSLDATQYISPLGAAIYLLEEKDRLLERGVDVVFQHYEHPRYRQLFPPFVPYASVLDLLFNEGSDSLEIIRTGRRTPLSVKEAAALGSVPQLI